MSNATETSVEHVESVDDGDLYDVEVDGAEFKRVLRAEDGRVIVRTADRAEHGDDLVECAIDAVETATSGEGGESDE